MCQDTDFEADLWPETKHFLNLFWPFNPFASEAVYTRNFFSDRMSDSV